MLPWLPGTTKSSRLRTRRDGDSLSRRTAGNATRWRSTARRPPGRGSCGGARLANPQGHQCSNATLPERFCDRIPVCPQDGGGDYMQFLRSSHQEALKEEERRHRFVAEKHCSLIQSIADIMNKVHGSPQLSEFLPKIYGFFFFSLLIDRGSKFSSAFSWCSLGHKGGVAIDEGAKCASAEQCREGIQCCLCVIKTEHNTRRGKVLPLQCNF